MSIAKIRDNKVIEKATLDALNKMTNSWRSLFDPPPPKTLIFTADRSNSVCLDGIPICDIADVNIHDMSYEPEVFFVGSNKGGYYRISIVWTYKNQLHIDEIVHVFYSSLKN